MSDYRPQVYRRDRIADAYTFDDATAHVLDVYEVSDPERSGRIHRLARRAVLRAYRDLPNRERWNYYSRRATFATKPSQETGKVDYDAATRALTISGATWPAWARFGRVILGGAHYPVEDRMSDEEITLSATAEPGGDLADQDYVLYQNAYPLPANFRRLDVLFDAAGKRPLGNLPPGDLMLRGRYFERGAPDNFSILAAEEYYGALSLVLDRAPSAARSYEMLYEASPRPLRTEREIRGTASATGSSVTGVSTVFSARHIGAIFRFGGAGDLPTGADGETPAAEERVVKSVESATALTLDSPVEESRSDLRYSISDPVDVEPTAMLTALLRMAEAEFSRLTGQEDRREKEAAAEESLLEAMAADSRYMPSGVAGGYSAPGLGGWTTEEVVIPNDFG